MFDAKIKLWDAGRGAWVWRKVATGLEDEAAALAVAVSLENASAAAKSGHLTRARAEALVNSILQLAGVPWGLAAVRLDEFGQQYVSASAKRAKDELRAKAPMHWERFKRWAGERIKWPLENWTHEMFQDYYADLRKEYSERTANDHLATFRQMFGRAVKLGKVNGNPAALVDKEAANSVEKAVFTRAETGRLVWAMRKAGQQDWCVLTLLGWHTGHRIQDLLSLTAAQVELRAKVGWVVDIKPAKKDGKGGRAVVLPLPAYLARRLRRLGDLTGLHGADNRNGKISNEFVAWMESAGINPLRVQRGKRRVPRKSFHSFRHAMVSRLAAAGVTGSLARLVTDHDSEQVHARYTHAEVASLGDALKKARLVRG